MTFGELFEIFLERHAKLKKRTWLKDVKSFNNYLKPLSNKRLSEIKKRDISSLHARLGKTHKTTANRILAYLLLCLPFLAELLNMACGRVSTLAGYP
jgi:hypothetical protein